MGLTIHYGPGQTPLSEEEKEGMKILSITNRWELDEFEQMNIEKALIWIQGKSWDVQQIIDELFIRSIHRRMYGDVWSWAGHFRTSNKNIGIDTWQISTALRMLCENTKLWVEESIYPPDEMAIRFKHQLVSIHCFPNGNGRHSRLMADLIASKIFHLPEFSWGGQSDQRPETIRAAYIQALQCADRGDIQPLIQFAHS